MSIAAGRPPLLTNKAVSALATYYFNFNSVKESTVKVLPSYYDRNYYLEGKHAVDNSRQFVLKLINPYSTSYQVIEGVIQVMKHLSLCGIACPHPVVSCTGKEVIELSNTELLTHTNSQNEKSMKYPVFIVSFIPGEVFDHVDKKFLSPELISEVGEMMGKIDEELLKNFPLKSFVSEISDDWNLIHFPKLIRYLPIIEDPCNRANTRNIIEAFKEHVSPKIPSFRTGIIHADVNGLNIIVNKTDDAYHVTGIIDFNDCINTCIIFELGISLAHMMRDNLPYIGTISDIVELVRPLISAYNKVLPLSNEELDSLYYLVLARIVLIAVNGARDHKAEPWNNCFIDHNAKNWTLVNKLLSIPKEKVDEVWKKQMTKV